MEKIVWESVILVNELWEYYEFKKGKAYPTPIPIKVTNRIKNTNTSSIINKSLDKFIKYIERFEEKNKNIDTSTNNTWEL